MSSRNDVKLGIGVVVAGLVILLGKWGVFGFIGRAAWPILIMAIGLLLHWLVFSRRFAPVLLIPGGVLTIGGVLLMICNLWGFSFMVDLWPVLLLGVAVGLYEFHAYEVPRPSGALPAAILIASLSILILVLNVLRGGTLYLIAVLLIAIGIWLLLGRRTRTAGRGKRRF